ncbi:MAG: aldo/keto reductase [Spirochaetia bacterium]|nr:aldo/keto reductase [Spirochaetia bacterium]
MNSLLLNNQVTIPVIGYGTWQIEDGREAYESVKYALESGYRHIDTAAAYYNEASVGKAIRESGLARNEIFLTTKLHNNDHGYEATRRAFLASLSSLGTEYVDLYLIHWPNPIASRENWKEANSGSWKAMEEFYEQGLVRAIGISNFCERHIDALLETATIKPMVNQIRLFAGEQQPSLVAYCRSLGIVTEAYSPLGTGKLLANPLVQTIALEVNRSAAQVCLRYNLQKGHVILPKSITPSSIKQNLELFDFALNENQMKSLDDMPNICGQTRNPDEALF